MAEDRGFFRTRFELDFCEEFLEKGSQEGYSVDRYVVSWRLSCCLIWGMDEHKNFFVQRRSTPVTSILVHLSLKVLGDATTQKRSALRPQTARPLRFYR